MDQNNSANTQPKRLDKWTFAYSCAYLYAIDHPGDPDRWRFCDELLEIRRQAVYLPEMPIHALA